MKAAGAGTKLQEIHTTELARCVSERAVQQDRLKEMAIGSLSAAGPPLQRSQGEKVELLESSYGYEWAGEEDRVGWLVNFSSTSVTKENKTYSAIKCYFMIILLTEHIN